MAPSIVPLVPVCDAPTTHKRLMGNARRLFIEQYSGLPPMSLADLTRTSRSLLEVATAGTEWSVSMPTDRAIRFYISKGCVAPPIGRGSSASYDIEHLVHVLFVKAKQTQGWNLSRVAAAMASSDLVGLIQEVESDFSIIWPAPGDLIATASRTADGMVRNRASGKQPSTDSVAFTDRGVGEGSHGGLLRRVEVESGLELLVDAKHPAFHRVVSDHALAGAIGEAIRTLLHCAPSITPRGER